MTENRARVENTSTTGFECPHSGNAIIVFYGENNEKEMDSRSLFRHIAFNADREDTKAVVLSGDDPLSSSNIEATKELLKILFYYGFKTTVFTKYEIDYVTSNEVIGFEFIKCGAHDAEKAREQVKDEFKIILSSPNQDFYDDEYNKISSEGILILKENK